MSYWPIVQEENWDPMQPHSFCNEIPDQFLALCIKYLINVLKYSHTGEKISNGRLHISNLKY